MAHSTVTCRSCKDDYRFAGNSEPSRQLAVFGICASCTSRMSKGRCQACGDPTNSVLLCNACVNSGAYSMTMDGIVYFTKTGGIMCRTPGCREEVPCKGDRLCRICTPTKDLNGIANKLNYLATTPTENPTMCQSRKLDPKKSRLTISIVVESTESPEAIAANVRVAARSTNDDALVTVHVEPAQTATCTCK